MASATQIVSLCVLIAFALVGPLIPSTRAAATVDVSIVDYAFQPSTVSIMPGDTVRWTNTVSTTHTATSDAGSTEVFDSGHLGLNGVFSHTFNTVGDFGYHCAIHTFMTGTVSVSVSGIPEFSNFAIVMIGLLVIMIGLAAALKKQ